MRDIWEEQLNWVDSGKPFVLARVIRTWRSAPRKSGAGMIIGKGMDKDSLPKVAGSVSGGCIEGAVIEEALEVLESGESRTLSYGVEDELALSVGLSCGGEVTILLEKHWALSTDSNTKYIWDTLQNCIRNNNPAVLISPLPAENGSSGENQSPLLILPEAENAVDLQNNHEEARRSRSLTASHSGVFGGFSTYIIFGCFASASLIAAYINFAYSFGSEDIWVVVPTAGAALMTKNTSPFPH